MVKIASILVVPSALGGIGLLYGLYEPPSEPSRYQEAYVVEVGVTFDEVAIRGALPEGLEPTPGYTGGIAIYGGDEGWALSPLSTGYVWIDVTGLDEAGGGPARYMVMGFASERPEEASPSSLTFAGAGSAEALPGDNTLHAAASPDLASILELSVRPVTETCKSGLGAKGGSLLTSSPGGGLGVIHVPVVLDFCEAEAVLARVSAPSDHVLGPFTPERVLWAGVATPLRWAMPELTAK